MINNPPQKPKRKLTALELSAAARGRLSRFKKNLGWTKTHSIEKGLELIEANIRKGMAL